MGQLHKYVASWKVKELFVRNRYRNLDDNHHPQILKELSLIGFPNLFEISLLNNEIESIEPITTIQAPSLQNFYISMWFINRRQQIDKCHQFQEGKLPIFITFFP